MVEEGSSSLTITAPVCVVGLVDGPDGRWEESGVGSEDVRSVVHWNVLTEDERSERRKTYHSTARMVALKAKAKSCTRGHSGEEGKGLVT